MVIKHVIRTFKHFFHHFNPQNKNKKLYSLIKQQGANKTYGDLHNLTNLNLGLDQAYYSPSGVDRTTTRKNTLGALGLSQAYIGAHAPSMYLSVRGMGWEHFQHYQNPLVALVTLLVSHFPHIVKIEVNLDLCPIPYSFPILHL